jgi:GT2 family glycosyltransferase
MITLSILVVNWNTRDMTTQCLQSLRDTADRVETDPAGSASLHYGPHTAEIIVVDNGSQDGSAAHLQRQFAWIRLIANQDNVGFAPANNQAYQLSTGAFVLLLNSDTIVHPGAIKTLLDFMIARQACGACGARLLNADGTLQPSCHPMLTPWREFWRLIFLEQIWRRATYDMARWALDQPRQVEALKGACLLVRRAALHGNAPLLDEQYFMYTEEVDLCYRLLHDGWQLYWIPQAQVTHFGEASSRQAYTRMYLQLYRSKVQFYRKFGGEQRAQRFKQLARIAYTPRLAAATLLAPLRPTLANRARVFRELLDALAAM